jgi:hypothetical protein
MQRAPNTASELVSVSPFVARCALEAGCHRAFGAKAILLQLRQMHAIRSISSKFGTWAGLVAAALKLRPDRGITIASLGVINMEDCAAPKPDKNLEFASLKSDQNDRRQRRN